MSTLSDSLTDSHLLLALTQQNERMHIRCFAWWPHLAGACHVSAAMMYGTISSATQGLTAPALSFKFTKVLLPLSPTTHWQAVTHATTVSSESRVLPILPLSMEGSNRDTPPSKRGRANFLKECFVQNCFALNAFYTESVVSTPLGQCISIP